MKRPKVMCTASVEGGDLTYADRPRLPTAPSVPVLAIHGLTANHVTFNALAEALDGRRVITPDLRGYGRSANLCGPYGIEQHVADLVALVDSLQIGKVHLVAHSMGASVAVVLAARHPDRVEGLVLVDGGLPAGLPPGTDIQQALRAVMGPTIERLEQKFASLEQYLDLRRQHPGLRRCWGPDVEEYVAYDLTGTAPDLISSTSMEAMLADAGDLFAGALVRDGWDALRSSGRLVGFIGAETGMVDQPPAVVPQQQVEAFVQTHPGLVWEFLAGTNHFSVLMTEHSAARIARMLDQVAGPEDVDGDGNQAADLVVS